MDQWKKEPYKSKIDVEEIENLLEEIENLLEEIQIRELLIYELRSVLAKREKPILST